MDSSKKSSPLVSGICNFYNEERFLEEAIESVLAQSYECWELLLIDDGSTDRSPEIAQRYAKAHPDRITYLQHSDGGNHGSSAARNLGLRHARGAYITFLDGDDVWLPKKLEEQIALLKAHPEAGMLCGATEYWHSWTGKPEDLHRDKVKPVGASPGLYEPPLLLTQLYPLATGAAPCMSALLVRREAIDRIGGFEDYFPGMYDDQAFLTKIYLNEAVLISDRWWDRYRQHPDSTCAVSYREGTYQEERRRFLEWFASYLKKEGYPNLAVRLALWKALWPHRYPRLRYVLKRSRHFYHRFRQKVTKRTRRLLRSVSS